MWPRLLREADSPATNPHEKNPGRPGQARRFLFAKQAGGMSIVIPAGLGRGRAAEVRRSPGIWSARTCVVMSAGWWRSYRWRGWHRISRSGANGSGSVQATAVEAVRVISDLRGEIVRRVIGFKWTCRRMRKVAPRRWRDCGQHRFLREAYAISRFVLIERDGDDRSLSSRLPAAVRSCMISSDSHFALICFRELRAISGNHAGSLLHRSVNVFRCCLLVALSVEQMSLPKAYFSKVLPFHAFPPPPKSHTKPLYTSYNAAPTQHIP